MTKKPCLYCGEEKSLTEFWKNKGYHDGYDNRCKTCKVKRDKEVNEIRKSAPVISQYCDCCGIENLERKGHKYQKFCLDHDPADGRFRGWLCRHCNVAIGLLGDNIEGLMKAVDYLNKPKVDLSINKSDLVRFFDDSV
jgi:hypothetical protein